MWAPSTSPRPAARGRAYQGRRASCCSPSASSFASSPTCPSCSRTAHAAAERWRSSRGVGGWGRAWSRLRPRRHDLDAAFPRLRRQSSLLNSFYP
eukprot:7385308-Prymnesium_polylepis.1